MLSMKAIPGAFHWILVEMARWFQEMLVSTKSCVDDISIRHLCVFLGLIRITQPFLWDLEVLVVEIICLAHRPNSLVPTVLCLHL